MSLSVDKVKWLPLATFTVLCMVWAWFYRVDSVLNEYGKARPEWVLLLDGFILLPIIYWFCIKDKRQAVIKILSYSCLVVLIGSFLIPEQEKAIWQQLELGRYAVVGAFLVIELVAVYTVITLMKVVLSRAVDIDNEIERVVNRIWFVGSLKIFYIRSASLDVCIIRKPH